MAVDTMAGPAEAASMGAFGPPGAAWVVHKFGGTCVGNVERISNVASILVKEAQTHSHSHISSGKSSHRQEESADKQQSKDGSEATLERLQARPGGTVHRLVVVSAMGGVTTALFSVVAQAEAGDVRYTEALYSIRDKHRSTVQAMLPPPPSEGAPSDPDAVSPEAAAFLASLDHDIANLKAMLQAIFIVRHATGPFRDFVVGHGELWSSRILASVLSKALGMPCPALDAREVLVVDVSGTQVDPQYAVCRQRLQQWYLQGSAERPGDQEGAPPAPWVHRGQGDGGTGEGVAGGVGAGVGALPSMVVATGFIARTPEGVPTTLQRDGSDFSATIFGALLGARSVTIWTDVDGVFSADPRKVRDARVLDSLQYQEAWEMSYFGASVLHPRTTVPVMRLGIPIFIRNAFNPSAPGTCIHSAPPPSAPHPPEPTGQPPQHRHHHHHQRRHHRRTHGGSLHQQRQEGGTGDGAGESGAGSEEEEEGGEEGEALDPQRRGEAGGAGTPQASRARRGAGRVGRAGKVPQGVVTGFATINDVALINVEGTGMAGVPGTASNIFSTVRDVGANVIAISQASSEHSVCFAVPHREASAVVAALERKFKEAMARGHISRVDASRPCSVLAAVGQRMASTPGVSAALFSSLANAGVNVRSIAQGSSEYNITVTVDAADTEAALNAAHARFFGAPTALALGLIGPGLIGGCLLEQLREQASVLREEVGLDLRVVAISSSSWMLLCPEGVDLTAWRQQLKEQGQAADLDTFARFVAGETVDPPSQPMPPPEAGVDPGVRPPTPSSTTTNSNTITTSSSSIATTSGNSSSSKPGTAAPSRGVKHSLPHAAVLDCTASGDVAALYRHWLLSGLNVITPNKKASSGPLAQYRAVMAAQRGPHSSARFFYEASVGAGLPILSTLQSLRDSGDRIVRIEGIFSGTLSYLFNTYDGEMPFSRLVQDARAAGYTEPDPRDDLGGMDVARKVVILAREAGLDLELQDVELESLVPQPLQEIPSAEDFLARLPEFDGDMAAKYKEAAAAGKVLRFVGKVDMQTRAASAQLALCDKSHPFAQLSGSDNIVAFYTKRYATQPLVVRGPGAGAEVTAGGVFADILHLSSYLGATC